MNFSKTRTGQIEVQAKDEERSNQGLVKDSYGLKDISKTRVGQKPQTHNLQGQVKNNGMLRTKKCKI